MGREIKRVPLDFDHPINKIWGGFLTPDEICPDDCKQCEAGGLNKATQRISDDYYDMDKTGREWCNNITQDEVQALVDRGRLREFTHTFEGEKGWVRREDGYIPTALEINEWNINSYPFGHDSLNKSILVKARAKRLGVYGACRFCKGESYIYKSSEQKRAYENWEPTEPPTGEGYQIWETVSEGSPISPVFKNKQEMKVWLLAKGYEEAGIDGFIESGWVMSGLIVNGEYLENINSGKYFGKKA